MESRTQALATKLAEKIYNNLHFEFQFSGDSFKSVSADMHTLIKEELANFLGDLALTKTQEAIFNETDLEKFAKNMAGKLTRAGSGFNIITGSGIATTELTTLYFKALDCKTAKLVRGAILPVFFIYTGNHWFNEHNVYENATHDILKGDIEERKKAVLLSFGHQLTLIATPDQKTKLCQELTLQENPLIHALRKPRSAIDHFFGKKEKEADTASYISYKDHLFNLQCVLKLLIVLSENKLVADLSMKIFSLFNPGQQNRLINALPCVNKELAKVKKEEMENLNKTYKRNC